MSSRTYITGERRRELIVEFVGEYWRTHGYAPSLRDIAAGVGFTTASSTVYQVDLLVDAGRLARTRNIPRSVRVVER